MIRILITQRLVNNSSYPEERDALDVRWANFASELGALIVPFPSNANPDSYIAEIPPDAIIFTGGNDLAIVSNEETSRKRDAVETKLLNLAIENKIPTLGVCRGMQLIGVRFGASLVPIEAHIKTRHDIRYTSGDLITRGVNSFHKYGFRDVGSPLKAIARAEDKTVESFRHEQLPILGIMWHPERERPFENLDLQLVDSVIRGKL